MGNCVSAASMVNVISPRITVLQAAEGRVVELEVPDLHMAMTVGELMLEFPPGHFVAHFDHADLVRSAGNNGTRASPLCADAEAKSGQVYVLFPMPRLHTRITPNELLTFAKLLHLHQYQQQLAYKGGDHMLPSKGATPKHPRGGLFTAGGARVAPLADEDDSVYSSSATQAAASCQDEQESLMTLCPNYPPIFNFQSTTSCHGQMQVIRCKPWAPKLETIQEIS